METKDIMEAIDRIEEKMAATSHHLIRVGTFQDVPTLSIFAY